jgi:hypothetical protein
VPNIYRYAVILNEPGTGEGMLAYVNATSRGAAQDECNNAVQDQNNIFAGCVFTIWPDPVASDN